MSCCMLLGFWSEPWFMLFVADRTVHTLPSSLLGAWSNKSSSPFDSTMDIWWYLKHLISSKLHLLFPAGNQFQLCWQTHGTLGWTDLELFHQFGLVKLVETRICLCFCKPYGWILCTSKFKQMQSTGSWDVTLLTLLPTKWVHLRFRYSRPEKHRSLLRRGRSKHAGKPLRELSLVAALWMDGVSF